MKATYMAFKIPFKNFLFKMFKILPTQKNPVQANYSLPKAKIGTLDYILYNIILF